MQNPKSCTSPMPKEFSFKDLSFTVNSKGSNRKTIIQNVSNKIKSGQMVAVMGPSGSGKTTLMNILALKANYGYLSGSIMLNGLPLDRSNFEKHCFYVEQYDKNWEHLTVNEVLTFAAKFSQSIDIDEIAREVQDVTRSISLMDVQDEYCSNLSGGQQRRLSLAIALLKKPSILLLDEPTSGLDSAASNKMCEILKSITYSRKLIVICTIHQPSTKVFSNFNQMMILSKGRLAYAGSTLDAEGYFASLGHQLPVHTNPPEFYLDLVDSDFGEPEVTSKILDAWSSLGNTTIDSHSNQTSWKQNVDIETSYQDNSMEDEEGKNLTCWYCDNFQAVFYRHFLLIWRDPILYSGRCVAFFIANCIFAFVYWDARAYEQEQISNKMWLLMWFNCCPTMLGAVAVSYLYHEIRSIQGEIKNGMMKPMHYIIAKQILTLPIIAIFALAALGVPMFVIQTFDPSSFLPALTLWSLIFYHFESLAETIAAWSSDTISGMLIYLTFWMTSFLFGGIFLTPHDIIWPLKVFYYVMPFQYYIRSMMYVLIKGSSFNSCDPDTNVLASICIESTSGLDVLEEFQKFMPVIKNPDPWHDSISILCMILFYKLLYIAGIMWKRSNGILPSFHVNGWQERSSTIDGKEESTVEIPMHVDNGKNALYC